MIAPVWRPAALLLAASQRNCAVRVRADAVRRVGLCGGRWGPQASDEPPTARAPDRLLAIRQLDAAVGWDAVSLGPAVVWPPIERARTGVSAANPQMGNAVGKVGCLRWERVPVEY